MFRVFTILLLLTASVSQAETTADKFTAAGIPEFTNAYRAWDGQRFKAATKLFREGSKEPSATAVNFYWLGVGEFHRLLQLLGLPSSASNKTAATATLEAAVAALTRAVELDASHAESHALLGTLYGMKISENILSAAWLGPRVQREQSLALADGADNPRVQYLLGMARFHIALGTSSRREALATLLRAEKLFAAEAKIPPKPLEPRWGHDSCLTFIGLSYEKLGQRAEAETYLRQALAMHPEDGLAQAGLARVTKEKK